ncbi:hypothetical protein [Mycoplasma parvum]|uniref:Uncharacterized protein n=1 Tax=Mycoplasma parvum str. Indiana TaxID=1403316 RepID=U5NCB9_9MOLU|nr:hypothetical protein [Mycoplasma parvum]AGX88955.1 hypothetical protein PRV_00950 [Mycoplasma parvum str. Indiana]
MTFLLSTFKDVSLVPKIPKIGPTITPGKPSIAQPLLIFLHYYPYFL